MKLQRELRLLAGSGLVILLGVPFAQPLSAQTASAPLTITEIKVEGNKNVSSLVINGHLLEKPGDLFSLRRLRLDIHALFSMGDFKDVKIDAQEGAKPGQVIIAVQVVEKPLVGKIQFQGNRKWDAKKLMESMKTASKTPFDEAKLNSDLLAVQKLYLEEGYPNATISSEVKEGPQGLTADVTVLVKEGDQIKVSGIKILGSVAFSAKKVADQVKDNHDGNKYRPDLLDSDLKKIETFYHDEGYLKAVVLDSKTSLDPVRKRVSLTITVREGDKYTAANIAFQGNVLFDDEDLMKALNLKKGVLLRSKDLEEGTRKVRTLYADKGYIYSSVTPKLDYDDEAKKVDISMEITEGQLSYVQDVKIVGNYKTRDYVIRRELAIAPGDKFEAAKIRLSAQNLYNLGFFDEVNPEIEPGDSQGKEVLVFRVKERKTGSISVGGGYSSVDGFVGNAKLEESNLFGKGQHANVQVEFGGSRTSFDLGFSEPWLFNTRTSLGVNIFDTTRDFIGSKSLGASNKLYTEVDLGGSISVGRRLSRYWSVFGAYALQNVQIKNVNKELRDPGSVDYVKKSDTWTSSFTPRLVFDSRDNYFDPTTGWKHQFSIEFAGGPFFGQNNFAKLIQDSSLFVPLPLGFVFGQHARFGAAQGFSFGGSFTEVPVNERFYAGGSDTVRGYDERTVGPLVGGNALFVSNTEFKHVIAGPLRGVLFFDMGTSWPSLLEMASGGGGYRMQFGAGVGARLTIPGTMIALRLDYGWPLWSDLDPKIVNEGGVLHFNLGDLF